MVNFQKFNVFKYMSLGLLSGIIAYVVGIIFKAIDIPIFNYSNEWIDFTASTVTVDLRNQVTTTGSFGQLGQKVVDFLTQNFSQYFSVADFFGVLVGATILVVGGRAIVGLIKVKPKMRTFLSFIAGGALMILLSAFFLGMDFMVYWASILAYSLGIAIIVQILISTKVIKFLEE